MANPNFSGHTIIGALVDETGTPISAANPLDVAATVVATASTVAKATAAAPTYSEGDVAAPLSVDLAGGLRITGTISATSAIKSTAADPSYSEGATTNPFSSDLAGYQRVKAKQSGTWSVGIDQTTPGTTNGVAATNFPTAVDVNSGLKSNSTLRVVLATDQVQLTNALKVDGSAVTQPVSAASLPLPTGAATVAKQPALGTAGTASADVISVQGIASMTALKVDGSAVTQPVSLASVPSHAVTNAGTFATQAAQSGTWTVGLTGVAQGSASAAQVLTPVGARTLSASPTDTTAQTNMPVLDLKGSLAVQPYGLGDNGISGLTAAMTGTASTAVTGIGAPGSGLYNYITAIVVGNSHATVGTFVELQDGSGGTTFFTLPAGAVYGGSTIALPKPLKQPTANTALYAKNTTTGANVIVSVAGFKAP